MTTIIYDHKNKQIAADSRLCEDSAIMTDSYQKWKIIDGDIWFFSGSVFDFDKLVDMYKSGIANQSDLECSAIMVKDGFVFDVIQQEKEILTERLCYNYSKGSGCMWALAGLDFGLSAKDAVKYAITRDSKSGGKVHVFDINKNKFVRG